MEQLTDDDPPRPPHPKTVLRLRDGVVLDDEPSPLMLRLMAGVPGG